MDPAVNTAVEDIGAILSRLGYAQGKEALEAAWKWYIGGPRPESADTPVIVEECTVSDG